MTVGSIMASRPGAPQRRYTTAQSVARLGAVLGLLVVAGVVNWPVLLFVLLFAGSIVAHEFGHYLMARRAGMKVTEFFIGFGPRIWSFHRGEVEYGLKAIPLGAYVKTPGMTAMETDIDPADEARTFRAQSSWHRALMIAAGPFMNLSLALVGFCVAFGAFHEPTLVSKFPAIEVADAKGDPPSPAATAGLRTGDVIESVAGVPIDPKGSTDQIGAIVRQRPDQQVTVVLERAGATLRRPVTLGRRSDCTSQGYLGVRPETVTGSIVRNPLQGIGAGAQFFGSAVGQTVVGIGKVFGPSGVGRIFKTVTRQACDNAATRPVSIIGITQIGGQAVRSGAQATIMLLSVVNLALGLLNLLPVLPLDGGHLLMTGIERWKRRRNPSYVIDYTTALPYFTVAIVVMAFVMLSALYLDTLRLF